MFARLTLSRITPLLAVSGLFACAKTDKAPAADSNAAPAAASVTPAPAEPPVITIVASNFKYEAPDTIPAGMVTLKLVNKGPELHHVQLVRLTGGKTYADFLVAVKETKPGTPPPSWIETVGGPNSPAPGGEMQITEDLPAGNYAMICLIPSTDHIPHLAKGMLKALTVIPSTTASAPAPTSDIRVAMTDYAWEVTPAITAGKHVIRLENLASQDHEMFIVRLEKGKTPLQVAQWSENPVGPPPATPIGGTSGMPKGAVVYVPVDLPAGEYALLCFIPDAKDGKAHYLHGMMKAFTVS